MQRLHRWRANSNIKRRLDKNLERRNGLSSTKKVNLNHVQFMTPESKISRCDKSATAFGSLSPIKMQMEHDHPLMRKKNKIIKPKCRKFITPVKAKLIKDLTPRKKSQSKLFREEVQGILNQLKIPCSSRYHNKFIKEYNQKVKETERWLNSRFEVILQSSSPSKTQNLALSHSVNNFAAQRTPLKNGSSLRSKILKKNLKHGNFCIPPFKNSS
jgi:hypothetical protein